MKMPGIGPNSYRHLVRFILVLLIGVAIGAGFTSNNHELTQYNLVTVAQKQEARQQIVNKFLDISTNCPSDSKVAPKDRLDLFYNYLKVNGFANRAVIRGCNEHDSLLAKSSSGEWFVTAVNIRLDTRVNPDWQKECLIEDITIPDDQVRSENKSIDNFNLNECTKLKG